MYKANFQCKVKPLLVSHYAENLGTTDYFYEYLTERTPVFYYLRHPLPEAKVHQSQLIRFDGESTLVRSFSSPRNFFVKTVKENILNLGICTYLIIRKRTNVVFCFGAINAFVPCLLRRGFKNVVFWGVDYSSKRFESLFLNKAYHYLESYACVNSDYVIQPSMAQQSARHEKHKLNLNKSLIAPNGVTPLKATIKQYKVADSLIYIGSLSPQHGVYKFIKDNMNTLRQTKLTIFGNGSEYEDIKHFVDDNNLRNIDLKGSCSPIDIVRHIENADNSYVGIAPYCITKNNHVAFGDSLKFKEYVNLGLNFITSDVVTVPNSLKQYAYVYKNSREMTYILSNLNTLDPISDKERSKTIDELSWNNIFDNVYKVVFNNYSRINK